MFLLGLEHTYTYYPQGYHSQYHDQQDDNNYIITIIVIINFFSDIEVTDVTVDVATLNAFAPYHHNTVKPHPRN